MKPTAKATLFQARSVERQTALELMIEQAEHGHKVVIGTTEPLKLNVPIGSANGKHLVPVRRATREEFLAALPKQYEMVGTPRGVPFYWELVVEAKAQTFEMPTHCVCGAVFMGEATQHAPDCPILKRINEVLRIMNEFTRPQ